MIRSIDTTHHQIINKNKNHIHNDDINNNNKMDTHENDYSFQFDTHFFNNKNISSSSSQESITTTTRHQQQHSRQLTPISPISQAIENLSLNQPPQRQLEPITKLGKISSSPRSPSKRIKTNHSHLLLDGHGLSKNDANAATTTTTTPRKIVNHFISSNPISLTISSQLNYITKNTSKNNDTINISSSVATIPNTNTDFSPTTPPFSQIRGTPIAPPIESISLGNNNSGNEPNENPVIHNNIKVMNAATTHPNLSPSLVAPCTMSSSSNIISKQDKNHVYTSLPSYPETSSLKTPPPYTSSSSILSSAAATKPTSVVPSKGFNLYQTTLSNKHEANELSSRENPMGSINQIPKQQQQQQQLKPDQNKDDTSSIPISTQYLHKYGLCVQFLANYIILSELGSGGFGFVVSAIRHSDHKEVAVKFIFKRKIPAYNWAKDKELGVVPMEVFLLKNLKHKGVVQYLDFYQDDTFCYLVMEMHGSPWTKQKLTYSTGFLTGDHKPKSYADKMISTAAASNEGRHTQSSSQQTGGHHFLTGAETTFKPKSELATGIPSTHYSTNSNSDTGASITGFKFNDTRATGTRHDLPRTAAETPPLFKSSCFLGTGKTNMPKSETMQTMRSSKYTNSTHSVNQQTNSPSGISLTTTTTTNNVNTGNFTSRYRPAMQRPTGLETRQKSFPLLSHITRRPSMDLFECIEKNHRLSEENAKAVFRQLVDCVGYLHSKGVIHRDIKDENIVIDDELNVKLIDFGSAGIEPKGNPNFLFDRFQGTIQYASPEIIRGEKYRGKPVDIWALGILLYTLLFGQVPFRSSNQVLHCSLITSNRKISPVCRDLLEWLLDKQAKDRPTIDQVAEHPWLRP